MLEVLETAKLRATQTFTKCRGTRNGVVVLDNIERARTRMHDLREEGKFRVSYEGKKIVGKKEFLNLGTVKY